MRTLALTLALIFPALLTSADEIIRIGMIGLDTSHVITFTKVINDPANADHVAGAKVVAAFKGGSPDVELSRTRIDDFTAQMEEEFGVEIVDSIESLCTMVDVIMLMSVDGRPHLAQATPVFEAGLPLFIDKPLAGSLADAIAIQRLGEQHGVKWFSSSSYRYYDTLRALQQEDIGELRGAISYGPCYLEPNHPDLFWYGVHPMEALYTVMGTGCESVVRTHTENTDVVTGVWQDGKVGTLRGLRDQATPHQVILFGTNKVAAQPEGRGNYAPLVHEIIRFFKTGEVPIAPDETIELFAFMTAADVSKERGGAPVTIAEVMAMAEAELDAR